MTATTLRCELFPDDIGVSVAFYRDVLGFELERDERDADAPYATLRRGDVRLGLARRPPVENSSVRRPPAGVELVLEVDDLVAERARVLAAGWPLDDDLVRRPWGLTDFRVVDPSGYYWRLTDRG
ncbi:VOC family protein [Microbacterium ulmi]|uniref:Glyoxalase n=1 Tax=Microbacterium ulmi TaxID=179095 RepID=A0A7Y2M1R3_9MICO|nr:VOC family protein [Microbacterium ulmi]NII68264.1 catechol 2,3-dioxygenase-like lactoylglutathione lyase family enzyme [Microbacterium ulmi]NNH04891.1 glyoxalase [Microbacterium ulmi]